MKNTRIALSIAALCTLLFAACSNPSGGSGSLSSAKAITGFSFETPPATGDIDGDTRTVTVMVPYGTDVTSLTPEIIYTGVSISPASGEAQDFTNPVTYVVTAADGSDAAWTVTVAEETFDIGQAIADSINAVLADDPSAGSTVTSPISLPLDINLSIPGMWADILAAVNTAASTWILTSPPV